MFYTIVNLFSYADVEERLDDLTEFGGRHPSSADLFRTITPSSRDSGIPIRSTSTSSCASPVIETRERSPERIFGYFLRPSTKSTRPMSCTYDSTIYRHRQPSPRRNVHWNEQSLNSSKDDLDQMHSHVEKTGRHVILNASLPFYSRLNIRVRTRREDNNENDHVTATAKIERIDPHHDQEHLNSLRDARFNHYSTLSLNTNQHMDSSIQCNRLPPHRQISLPIALPINQQLLLYIRNGEVYARC
ncbi:unnamed protein product [Adineta ricciae]|uniref:Uncharacterized protein n=1 Tax=Adineta ricciae TaxID=249248 RepID=A0A813QW62_ADIRI|nr:unnamed protein product [Adineta ricciae]